MTGGVSTNRPFSIGRLLRPIGFTISYPIFALSCCLLALAAPVVVLVSADQRERARKMRLGAMLVARGYLQLCRGLGLISVNYVNPVELPAGLIVANHPSLVDAIWILATQPDLCCVLKGDLQRFKVLQLLVQQLGWVSNRDPEQLLREGCERLRAGETLLVFPEGTRTLPGQPVKFRLGAAELALRSGVPVHPIVIHKHGRYLSKSSPWYDFPADKIRWSVEFAPTLSLTDASQDIRVRRRQLTADLQHFFRKALRENKILDVAKPPEVAEPHVQAEN